MNNSTFIKILLCSPLCFGGCTPRDGTSTGNPDSKAGVQLSIQGTKPNSLTASKYGTMATTNIAVTDAFGASIGSLTLSRAHIALRQIEIATVDGTGGDAEIDFAGPYVVDLLTNTITPSLEQIKLPPGSYNEVELELHRIDGSESDDTGSAIVLPSDPLYGNSIYLEGTYTGQTASGHRTDVPFKLSFDFGEQFQLAGPSPENFDLIAGEISAVLIAFRLNRWLRFSDSETNPDQLSLADLSPDAGGEIILNESSAGVAASARKVIKENIKKSADFGKDLNDDGVLDRSEDADPDSDDTLDD